MSLGMEQLKDVSNKMGGKESGEQAKILKDALGFRDDSGLEKKSEKISQKNGSVNANGNVTFGNVEKKENRWRKEEIELLKKGMQKYPKGTSRRWEVISEYIGAGRSVEEILKATKTFLLQKPESSKAFNSFLEKRKPAATIASPRSTREEIEGAPTANGPEGSSKMQNPKASCGSTVNNQSPSDASMGDAATSSGSDQDVWSAVQERALVFRL